MARIVVVTMGTYGDVVPYLGLGQRLTAAGHVVTVATVARFAETVTSAGLAFHELPAADPREVAASAQGRSAARGGLRGMLSATRTAAEIMRRPVPAMISAIAASDIVLSTSTSLLAAPIAEAHKRPLAALALQPVVPTRTHGPALLGGRNLGPWLNKAVPALFTRLGMRAFAGLIRDVRAELDLPATPAPGYRDDQLTLLHGISPTVYPRPSDWRPGADVVGYWWPPALPDSWEPEPALVEFFARGPAPIYIGFGSMGTDRAEQVAATLSKTLHATGHRAIVSRGWADLRVAGPDVLTIDDVPHSWLFPRVAAVVHHAGAGTTAAGLRAGVPVVPVPFAYDQHFWARRLVELGVAPRALPARSLKAKQLAGVLHEALTNPTYRQTAATIADDIAAEDGTGRVIDLIEQVETVAPRGTPHDPLATQASRRM